MRSQISPPPLLLYTKPPPIVRMHKFMTQRVLHMFFGHVSILTEQDSHDGGVAAGHCGGAGSTGDGEGKGGRSGGGGGVCVGQGWEEGEVGEEEADYWTWDWGKQGELSKCNEGQRRRRSKALTLANELVTHLFAPFAFLLLLLLFCFGQFGIGDGLELRG